MNAFQSNEGEVTTQNGLDFTIDNDTMQILPGLPVMVRFFVQYDPQNATPRVQEIKLNGLVICETIFVESRSKTNLDMKQVRSVNSLYKYE